MSNTYISVPNFNPVFFSICNVSIHWYGVMYLLGFAFISSRRNILMQKIGLKKIEVDNLLYFSFFGLFIGGRIGYIFFYNPLFFFKNILCVFKVWEGGMSFHGGLLGVILVIFYFSRKFKKNFFLISDLFAPLVPVGLGLGRIGNFINGELFGRVAPEFYFSFLFPTSRNIDVEISKHNLYFQILINKFGVLPRHPSQIYEFFLEGVILFVILYFFSKKIKVVGIISSMFLILYGCFRIIVEFFREPDRQLGLLLNFFTMGQVLSIPMIIFGFINIIKCYSNKKTL
ncbi:MAG: prolipoprotein diacylglyceryl transferase [Buchnera aphidicola (Schlechtendalia peitan)]